MKSSGTTSGAFEGQTKAGGLDAFVAKYDTNGNKVWVRQLGTAGTDSSSGVAADPAGNVYVAGDTTGALDGQTSAGAADLFIAKYDANGNKQWTRQLGTNLDDAAQALTADAAGNLYVAGRTNGAIDGQASAGGYDGFVTKYDVAGKKLWTRQFGAAGGTDDGANATTSDAAGNVYVAGATFGPLDGQTSAGSTDFYVTKYDPYGSRSWTRVLGTFATDQARSISSDPAGNVYVAGDTDGSLDGKPNAGSTDLFIVKLQADGRSR